MAGERLLRHRVINEPSLIGATSLKPAEPPIPRGGMRETTPCVVTGTDLEGKPIVAVFTDTVDVDIIGFGVDAQLREERPTNITIITYTGNVTSTIRSIAVLVKQQTQFLELV